jgi:hypothetical protein
VHQGVELGAASSKRLEGAGRGDQHTRPPAASERRAVARREVHAVERRQIGPPQPIAAARPEPLADHGDRALAVCVEVDEHTPEALAPPELRPHLDAHETEIRGRVATLVVAAQRREERRAPAQVRQLHGSDRATSRGRPPRPFRMHDLAGPWQSRDTGELGRFDVPNHGEPKAAKVRRAQRRLRSTGSRSHPSRA